MKTATGLTLVAIGAILAFAVKAHPHFLNLQVAGWVIILTGLVGIFVPRRGYGWLRGHPVVRKGSRMLVRKGSRRPVIADGEESISPHVIFDAGPSPAEDAEAPHADDAVAPDDLPPGYEVVEEYYEE
jgi:hypothetical protein